MKQTFQLKEDTALYCKKHRFVVCSLRLFKAPAPSAPLWCNVIQKTFCPNANFLAFTLNDSDSAEVIRRMPDSASSFQDGREIARFQLYIIIAVRSFHFLPGIT